MGSPDADSSNAHLRYVTCACCFIFISFSLIFSLRIFLSLCLLGKRIDLVFLSQKWIQNFILNPKYQYFKKTSIDLFVFQYVN